MGVLMRTDIIVHDPQDDVGVVVVDSISFQQAAEVWVVDDGRRYQLTAKDRIPLGHKVALRDFQVGDQITKYGHDIGKVISGIKKGDHVHVHNVKTKRW